MLQTTVARLPGDKSGPDISDPLLSTKEAQTQRGRGEINEQSSSRVICAGNCPASGSIAPGSIARITDAEYGQYNAVIDSWSLTIDVTGKSHSVTSSITFEREQR
jgi:hypothetical protein